MYSDNILGLFVSILFIHLKVTPHRVLFVNALIYHIEI